MYANLLINLVRGTNNKTDEKKDLHNSDPLHPRKLYSKKYDLQERLLQWIT